MNAYLNGFGGGAVLNFRIRAYGSAEELPQTAMENTIAVITGNEITGWTVDYREPETAAEGMVWIRTGTTSKAAFNASKKEVIRLYPVAASQYTGGVWVSRKAYSYRDGAWIPWATELITAAWRAIVSMQMASYTLPGNTVPYLEAAAAYVDAERHGRIALETEDAYDLTNVETVTFRVDEAVHLGNASYPITLYAKQGRTTSAITISADASAQITASITDSDITVDVSALTGSYYIGIHVMGSYNPTGTNSCRVSSVQLD